MSTFKPLETIDLPEQGPLVLIPEGVDLSRSLPITSGSYGVPIAPISTLKPLETIDLPEQGPVVLRPDFNSRNLVQTLDSYEAIVPKPFKPLETIDLPEQGPVVLRPDFSSRNLAQSPDSYGAPIAAKPFKPLETIDLPEQGPVILKPEESDFSRIGPNSGFLIPDNVDNLLYNFQFEDPQLSRQEMRHANGVTKGFYSYLDPNGKVQRVEYVADQNGYRVLNEPLVQDTQEVAKAKVEFFKAYQAALNQVTK